MGTRRSSNTATGVSTRSIEWYPDVNTQRLFLHHCKPEFTKRQHMATVAQKMVKSNGLGGSGSERPAFFPQPAFRGSSMALLQTSGCNAGTVLFLRFLAAFGSGDGTEAGGGLTPRSDKMLHGHSRNSQPQHVHTPTPHTRHSHTKTATKPSPRLMDGVSSRSGGCRPQFDNQPARRRSSKKNWEPTPLKNENIKSPTCLGFQFCVCVPH